MKLFDLLTERERALTQKNLLDINFGSLKVSQFPFIFVEDKGETNGLYCTSRKIETLFIRKDLL
jgi:hypothetical protein